MVIEEYKNYYDRLISSSEDYIRNYGVFRGSKEKARAQKLDYNFVIDYRFFVLSKATKTLKSFYKLLECGLYEDAIVLTRTMYECYLSNRFFEEKFDVNIQTDMVMVPINLATGRMVEGEGTAKVRESGETVDYTQHGPQSLIMGKDKAAFYPLYSYLCTLAHCNFSQCVNYLKPDLHFTIDNAENAALAHVIGLYVFSKIFESTILIEGMPIENEDRLQEYKDLLIELTTFMYWKLDDVNEFPLPFGFSVDKAKEIFKYMKNSYKEQLGQVEKTFVTDFERQKKQREKEKARLKNKGM